MLYKRTKEIIFNKRIKGILLGFLFLFLYSNNIWAKYGIQIASSFSLNKVYQIYKTFEDYDDVQIIKLSKSKYYALFIGAELKPASLKPLQYQIRQNTRYKDCFIAEFNEDPIIFNKKIKFKDLGYTADIMIRGVKPAFSFFLPIYASLKDVKVIVPIRISPLIDKKSTIELSVDDMPQKSGFVYEFGTNPTLEVPIPVNKNNGYLKVTIGGYFFKGKNVYKDLLSDDLWMIISKDTEFILTCYKTSNNIQDFFHDYSNSINLVIDREPTISVLELGYNINKIYDWKKVKINLTNKPIPQEKNVIIGDFDEAIRVEGDNLYVNYKGISLLNKNLVDLYITEVASSGEYFVPQKKKKGNVLTFRELGFRNSTITQLGNLYFYSYFNSGDLGGFPDKLFLRLNLSHSPVPEGAVSYLKLFINNSLIKAIELEGEGIQKSYDVEVPTKLLNLGSNELRLANSYYLKESGVENIPELTITIYEDSYYYWDTVQKKVESIVDFLYLVNGKVALCIEDNSFFVPAYKFIDLLGKINKNISKLDVLPWHGEVPKGYDYVIVFANPNNVHLTDLPLRTDKGDFKLVNPLDRQEEFNATFQEGMAVIELGYERKKPVLLFTYYNNPAYLTFLNLLTDQNIGKYAGNIILMNETDVTSYQVGDKLKVIYQLEKGLSYYWNLYKLPLAVILGVLIILLMIYVYRNLSGRMMIEKEIL